MAGIATHKTLSHSYMRYIILMLRCGHVRWLLCPFMYCREIGEADLDAVADLLARGFPLRSRDFWVRSLARLSAHPTPSGFPKYGYVLEHNGALVGVILLIFSRIFSGERVIIRCSVSSWYVTPPYGAYAAMLASVALKCTEVTYFNITPGPSTLPILKMQGYARYCTGRFIAAPALCAWSDCGDVKVIGREACLGDILSAFETKLLRDHAAYGCVSLVCGSYPFVFLPLRKAGGLRIAYLAYSRTLEDFARFAGPLGRFLARHGFLLVVVDSNGPIKGVIGRYLDSSPKYFKGPDKPRLGDIAYSERAMFRF